MYYRCRFTSVFIRAQAWRCVFSGLYVSVLHVSVNVSNNS